MVKNAVKYCVVDAFTESPFKGNPAAVCLLEEEEEREEGWFQSVATEFNVSQTCFLTPIATTHSDYSTNPRFHLRWFTPVAEVVLPSAKEVAELQPQFDEIQKLPSRGLIITGLAPPGSGFDFYSRFFCPKLGIKEDPVCGSAHCALAPYWCQKMGKCDCVAYQASPRGGIINLHLDEKNRRILLRGKAIIVMEGSLLV